MAGRDVSGIGKRSWWTRGHNCISGIWSIPAVYGLIIEVGFIDQAAHAPLWTDEGIERCAAALAEALLALAWMRDPRRPWRLTGQWLLLALLLKVLLEPFLASQGALPDWVAWPLHGTGLVVALVWSGISHKRAA